MKKSKHFRSKLQGGLFVSFAIFALFINSNPIFAQCDYVPGATAMFANTGYDAANVNICYLVEDATDQVIASDDSGNCDFPNLVYGSYSVYALNDCLGGASDIEASPPTTRSQILTYGNADDVDIAGPASFSVCEPSALTACENHQISVSMQPDFNIETDYEMVYTLVCSNIPEGNTAEIVQERTDGGSRANFLAPYNGSESSQANCTAYAINYKKSNLAATAAADAITPGSDWTAVNPTGSTCVDVASAAATILPHNFPTCNTPLLVPIELNVFKGECTDNGHININWETGSETEVLHFLLEKAFDGLRWEVMTKISPEGNEAIGAKYSYEDTEAQGEQYYRLVTVNLNGTLDYSEVIQVACRKEAFAITTIYPNPTNDKIWIGFEVLDFTPIQVQIVDVLGRVIIQEELIPSSLYNRKVLDLSAVDHGNYFVFLNNGQQQLIAKVVKQ